MSDSNSVREIPFFNYRAAFASREDEFIDRIRDVVRRGAYIQQKDLAEFEQHLADYLGVKHAFGVANGTDGLIMSLRAVGIHPGDEVIVPSHTMVATASSVWNVGGIPVMVDCGPDHLVDPSSIVSAITAKTRAIMPVQLNGRTCDMDAIMDIAHHYKLVVVEDACQGLGSKYKGKFAGTFGKAAVFSFYPAKILGCFGDGGAVVTDDDDVAEKLKLIRDHGRNDDGEVVLWGLNSRLDNMQAAILDIQFKDYQAIIDKRRCIAAIYDSQLQDVPGILLPPGPDANLDHYDVFQNYEIEVERRDDLRLFLKDKGIGTIIQWGGKAVHQFKELGFNVILPYTEKMFTRCLMLPMNTTLTDDEAGYISEMIREFYER